ncbi:restriction endonuclease subunit S [Lactobacillus gallinarum]|uniref:Type I restriction modification DNA specificity domain-containing protein n=1 Tax=Lactobacillus gallinarum TaxID=52242 RepID=A0ABX3Z9Q3_9LACO|nr:restriction endonuclease subunit S [Lactobacillus gallinarum]OUQ56941.1 hypothetical protein B5E59_04170 [Lactobacillus gallinarum]
MTPEQLRASILQYAMEGKLVKQDPNDESASELLQKIEKKKDELIKEKKIRKIKKLPTITDDIEPFSIPKTWDWKYLSDIANITKLAGFEYTKYIKPNLTNKGIPIFKAKNIQSGKTLNDFENYIPEKLSDELVRSQLNKKCLLTPYVGSIGKVAIFSGKYKAHLGSNVGKIEMIKNEGQGIDEEFIMYYLQSPHGFDQLTKYLKSTAQPSISITALREVIVPLPPLEEQKRIVAKIEKLMPLVDEYAESYNRLQKIDNEFEDKLKQSVLQYAMEGKLVKQDPSDEPASELIKKIENEKAKLIKEGKIKKTKKLSAITDNEKPFDIPDSWEWVRLDTVLDVRDGTHDTPKYVKNGIPLITSKNISNGHLDFSNIKYISEKDFTEINKRSNVEKGDIIFAMIGSIGNPVIVDTDRKFGIKNVALLKNINHSLDMNFVLHYLYLLENLWIKNASGAVQKFISLKKIRSSLIPFPPLEEQRRIVEKVEELQSSISNLSK